MSRHHPDLVMCRKQSGISIGRVCDKCDGKCPVCDSYVRPTTLVRVCDECSFGNYQNKCVVCGGEGISDAFYCAECTRLEKDRDGCPKIINLGSSRTDVSLGRAVAVYLRHHELTLWRAVILSKENESNNILARGRPGLGLARGENIFCIKMALSVLGGKGGGGGPPLRIRRVAGVASTQPTNQAVY
jgi:PHD finger-like domain-containing protein 5A